MTTPTPPAGTSTDIAGTNPDDLVLAADFESPTWEQWVEEIRKTANRGRPEDKQLSAEEALSRLQVKTVDGLTIEPIYTKKDAIDDLGVPGAAPFTRGTTVRDGSMGGGWDIRTLHEDPDVDVTRKAILTDLERGATSIWLRVDDDAIKPADVAAVLADVQFELAKVEVSSRGDQAAQAAAADALLDVIQASGVHHASVNLGIDPIGAAALNGGEADLSDLASWVEKTKNLENTRPIVVDGTVYHNAGAGDVHELGYELATGVEYVRALIEQGVSADDAFEAINFRVTATTDQVLTISRIRALRTAWNRVGEVFEVSEEKRGARQIAVTSWREITRDDPYVNILRSTVGTFSAAVAGAESIVVLPFDTAWGLPGEFSRRVARNTQVVLAEESNLGRVNDAAGGGWYFEQLTKQMAEQAWEVLQAVEAAGGMAAHVAADGVAADLEPVNAERAKRLATRKQPITGVSEFPNPSEKPLDAKERPAAPQRSGLVWTRDSQAFEDLRDATAGTDAQVFLACVGTRRDYGGREGFASNFFQVAGLKTPQGEGADAATLVEKWQQSNTPVVCICTSPKLNAEMGFEVAKAFKDAGAKKVILAGNVKELGDVDTDGVIDSTIAMGADVIASLTDVLETLEVNK